MKHISAQQILKSGLAALAVMVLLCSTAFAARTGTVTLKDGTVYEVVTFSTNNVYKVIEFKVDDEKKVVSFTDIESIVDANGDDITIEVIGGYVEAEESDNFLSETDEAYKFARRKLWNAAFSLGGNYSFPAGDYYEDLNSGLGFDADVAFALTYRLALRFSVTYTGIDYDDDLAYMIVLAPGEALIAENFNFSSMSYFASFQYYHRPDRDTPGKMIYYFYTGLGLVTHGLELDEVIISGGVEVDRQTISDDETKFATTIGGGLTYLFEKSLGIYAGASVDVAWLGSESDEYDFWGTDMVYAHQFRLEAGLTYFIK